jgi:succinoglycan biosynthesis transport protein ExoP
MLSLTIPGGQATSPDVKGAVRMSGRQDQQTELGPAGEVHLWEYVHVLLRRRNVVLAVFSLIVVLATVRTLMTQPVYQGTTSILIERHSPNVLDFKDVTQADMRWDDYYQTQYKLLQSRVLARSVVEQMNLLNDPEFGGPRSEQEIAAAHAAAPGASPVIENAVSQLLRGLKIVPVRNSRLVNVSFEAHRPALAASVANRLSQMYIQQALDFRFQTSSEAGTWLETQVSEQRKKVEHLDKTLADLRQREGLVNIEERRTLLEQRLKELGTALNERKTERLQKEALWHQMSGASNSEELPDVARSPLIQNLRIELANLQRQEAQLLERYMDQHPEVVKVRNQIRETRSKIRSEAKAVIGTSENDYRASAAQEANISAALEAAKAEALDLSRRTVNYDSQKRELDAANQVLNSLLTRSKETDVSSELKSSNIRIVDTAVVPSAPIRPRTVRDILVGMLLGFGVAVGLAFFLDYLDNTLKTPDDVRNHLAAPLLGVLPEQTEGEATVLIKGSDSTPFGEGYRVVRTSLGFCWPEAGPRTIVVTSTSPSEGKSVTSVNLALSLSGVARRVLLVDCDLRKPRAHSFLGARRSPGLSDVLVGKAKLSEAIQFDAGGTGVNLLAAGTSAPSPADLLTHNSLRVLLEGLRTHYDWIVIDTPPVGAVSDPLVVAPLADGVVIVAGAEMVPRGAVKHTLERISETGARILGIVLNRAQTERHSYYYGKYYGHYYGHYYGQETAKTRAKTASASMSKVASIRKNSSATR